MDDNKEASGGTDMTTVATAGVSKGAAILEGLNGSVHGTPAVTLPSSGMREWPVEGLVGNRNAGQVRPPFPIKDYWISSPLVTLCPNVPADSSRTALPAMSGPG